MSAHGLVFFFEFGKRVMTIAGRLRVAERFRIDNKSADTGTCLDSGVQVLRNF
jgi:hypothetical protein